MWHLMSALAVTTVAVLTGFVAANEGDSGHPGVSAEKVDSSLVAVLRKEVIGNSVSSRAV